MQEWQNCSNSIGLSVHGLIIQEGVRITNPLPSGCIIYCLSAQDCIIYMYMYPTCGHLEHEVMYSIRQNSNYQSNENFNYP